MFGFSKWKRNAVGPPRALLQVAAAEICPLAFDWTGESRERLLSDLGQLIAGPASDRESEGIRAGHAAKLRARVIDSRTRVAVRAPSGTPAKNHPEPPHKIPTCFARRGIATRFSRARSLPNA
jgi:hypothetical protein